MQTWEPVFTALVCFNVCVLNIRICWSAAPPPDANIYDDLHPIAFTAALCYVNYVIFLHAFTDHKDSLLSLPPLAIILPYGLHFNPQIYWQCAEYRKA